jgi:hypothetical protein
MRIIITNILNKFEFFKYLRSKHSATMGSSANDIYSCMKYLPYTLVDCNEFDVAELKPIADFLIEKELWEKEADKEALQYKLQQKQYERASFWYNSLSDEEKSYVSILGSPVG